MVSKINELYTLSIKKQTSDPIVSESYAAKADILLDELNTIRKFASLVGIKFRIYERVGGTISIVDLSFGEGKVE